jgi:hypothetical protein
MSAIVLAKWLTTIDNILILTLAWLKELDVTRLLPQPVEGKSRGRLRFPGRVLFLAFYGTAPSSWRRSLENFGRFPALRTPGPGLNPDNRLTGGFMDCRRESKGVALSQQWPYSSRCYLDAVQEH